MSVKRPLGGMGGWIPNTFTGAIRTAREARGWTIDELAHYSGATVDRIRKIERGHKATDRSTVRKLQRALELCLIEPAE